MSKWLSSLISAANMKSFVNLLPLATFGSLVAVAVITPNAGSVTIKDNFTGGVVPNNTVGGGNLVDIFRTAADWWELAIRDDFTVNIDFGWTPLDDNMLGASRPSPLSRPTSILTLCTTSVSVDN